MYKPTDLMRVLVEEHYELLQVLSRFGLALGFGDKSIKEVCEQQGVDVSTFLAVVNLHLGVNRFSVEQMSVQQLISYLRKAHIYFLDFSLPMIRRKLIDAITTGVENKISLMILQYFNEYTEEVRKHMDYEDREVFPYVEDFLQGKVSTFSIDTFAHQHRTSDDDIVVSKLTELKNIIVKYYPSESHNEMLYSVLSDIFAYQQDLASHCRLEDEIFIPVVRYLEGKLGDELSVDNLSSDSKSSLSSREIDVVVNVVKGLTNKEIADRLCLSVHTITTHRKNISRKLHIHSSAGLTIYAIVNQLVDINDLPDFYASKT